jgi:hypothetical protein
MGDIHTDYQFVVSVSSPIARRACSQVIETYLFEMNLILVFTTAHKSVSRFPEAELRRSIGVGPDELFIDGCSPLPTDCQRFKWQQFLG